jgi:hypothetical protein
VLLMLRCGWHAVNIKNQRLYQKPEIMLIIIFSL